MSFNNLNLHPNVAKGIAACGYTKPTPVQSKAIPEILQGRDVVASAQTGTGKTAAFVLPALHYLNSQPHTKQTRILILTPTRELAAQITKAASLYGKFSRYNIISLVGGMSYHHQIKDLQRGADIIVATPGRLLDHIEQRRVNLSNIEMLILDEADRMLDMGFIEDVEYIAKLTPGKRQTLLFSATVDKKLATTIRHLLKDPVRIDLSDKKMTAPDIKQELYKINNPHHKQRVLKQFLNDSNIYKAIIFSATKINAERLADQLQNEGFNAGALHGDLRQNVRNRTIEELRRGKIQYLVATDVAARGIDISDITHVINYDFPKFSEDYVHRIGRTGRAGKTGTAISFVLPTDLRHVQGVEKYIGQRLQLLQLNASGEATQVVEDAPRVVPFERKRDDFHKRKNRSGDAPRGKRRDDNSHFVRDDNRNDKPKKKRFGGDRPFDKSNRPERDERRSNDTPRSERFAKKRFDADAPRGDEPKRKRFGADKPFAKSSRGSQGEGRSRGEGRGARPSTGSGRNWAGKAKRNDRRA